MDPQLIKSLIDALEASDLTELEYSRDGSTLRLVKGGQAVPPATPPAAATPRVVPARPAAPAAEAVTASDLVAAPLYGVVHLQRAPGAPPFVAAGDTVTADQVLCTVEAMKVFTDVRAGRPGTVAAILVADGQEAEAGQPLFRLS